MNYNATNINYFILIRQIILHELYRKSEIKHNQCKHLAASEVKANKIQSIRLTKPIIVIIINQHIIIIVFITLYFQK